MVRVDGAGGGKSLIKVRGLDKKYERGSEEIHVLQGLNLEVDAGDFVAEHHKGFRKGFDHVSQTPGFRKRQAFGGHKQNSHDAPTQKSRRSNAIRGVQQRQASLHV